MVRAGYPREWPWITDVTQIPDAPFTELVFYITGRPQNGLEQTTEYRFRIDDDGHVVDPASIQWTST